MIPQVATIATLPSQPFVLKRNDFKVSSSRPKLTRRQRRGNNVELRAYNKKKIFVREAMHEFSDSTFS